MDLTKHAMIRSRQRGFSPALLDIISNYGRHEPTVGGATKVSFGKKESLQLIREAKRLIQMFDKINNATLIVKDGCILTMYKHH